MWNSHNFLCSLLFALFIQAAIFLSLIWESGPAKAGNGASPIISQVGALGAVEPRSHVITIGSPNIFEGARIKSLSIQEGMTVQKGAVLGYFSTYDRNKAAVDVAQAQVVLAKAILDDVKAGNKESDLHAQRQTIESVRSLEKNSQTEYERLLTLQKQGVVSKARLDVTEAAWRNFKSQRLAAEEKLKSLSTVRSQDIAVAKSKLAIAEAEYLQAQKVLDLSVITAPISGTIIDIYARDGEAVGNEGIMDIADLSAFDVVAEVDEGDISKISVNQIADIEIDSLKKRIKGSVREIGWQVKRNNVLDPNPNRLLDTRVVEVRISIDQEYTENLKHMINSRASVMIHTQ